MAVLCFLTKLQLSLRRSSAFILVEAQKHTHKHAHYNILLFILFIYLLALSTLL